MASRTPSRRPSSRSCATLISAAKSGSRFTLRRGACPAEHHFRRWYLDTGTEWLRRRVATLAARVGTTPTKVEVRDLGFRWGSCGKNSVLFFNWKVLQLPVRRVDYIILHELIHLVEGHHGPEFPVHAHAGPRRRSHRERNAGHSSSAHCGAHKMCNAFSNCAACLPSGFQ
ncbi:MAG: M48 family metallopeptidase [Verrucomicrobiota bacterium]